MNTKTKERMQHFVGRVCSIVTTAMNRNFDETICREHFVVVVEEIDFDGIWGTHPYNAELWSFFSFNHVISIHQEEVLDPKNPEHAQMIKDFESKTGKKVQSDLKGGPKPEKKPELLPVLAKKPKAPSVGDATFIDIESLERLAEETQKASKTASTFS